MFNTQGRRMCLLDEHKPLALVLHTLIAYSKRHLMDVNFADMQAMNSNHMYTYTYKQNLLFCLYGLVLSDIVAWDVPLPLCLQATGLPPVTIIVLDDFKPFSFLKAQIFTCSLVVIEKSKINRASGNVRCIPRGHLKASGW